MTPQFALVPADDIRALADEVRALRAQIEGSTIVPPPKWVSIPEAARVKGCHPATIRRAIMRGHLEARGSGKARQVKLA